MIQYNKIDHVIITIWLFMLNACNSTLSLQVNPEYVARHAEDNQGNAEWAYNKPQESFDPKIIRFRSNTCKCCLFVYDMLSEVGIHAPKKWDISTGYYWPLNPIDWTESIPEFSKVSTPKRGDIISDGIHCGIVVGDGKQLIASEKVVDSIYYFNKNSTIQRYNGPNIQATYADDNPNFCAPVRLICRR